MNCKIRWIEQQSGREGFFYSGLTDLPLELPFLNACAYASEQQAISNKWGWGFCYQVVDSQGEIVYNTCQQRG